MQKFTGLEYVKINIANHFGLDKLTWKERIDWVNSHEIEQLYAMVPDADEPMLMLKGINALEDALDGIPTGFIMGLDATASGLQIMACLMGCFKTAANVNLVNTGKREDIYQKGADVMAIPGIDRAIVKKPIMTTFYGSLAQPKSVFGEGTPELKAFYEMLNQELPGAMECMRDIQSCWDPTALEYKWTLPDDHVAVMKVMVDQDFKIEVDELNHATFTYRTQINMPTETGLSLAANIVHSIDGWIVREMYRRANKQGFEILTIHDSFWCSPNHMNQLRQNYIDILAELADMPLLQNILNEVTKNPEGVVTKYSDKLSEYIRQSEYALS